MQVQVQELAQLGRKLRKPKHTFQLRAKPWQIQPFFIAPVLPGETMKNLLLQSRVVTDPIKNRLVGWWAEYYVFFVKLRDLDGRDDFVGMLLDPAYDLDAYAGAAATATYHAGFGIDWTAQCLDRVVAEYFRNDNESSTAPLIDGLPLASISTEIFTESLRDATAAAEDQQSEVPGVHSPFPADQDAAKWAAHFAQWESMRELKLTTATFEDWLATFGVKAPKAVREEDHRPELVRYVRDWSYPSNTINPADGSAASAVSWSIAERADKDRFIKEPGFLFGVQVIRPKVYFSRVHGAGVGMMQDAYSFLPAVLSDQPWTSLKAFETSTGADGPLKDGPTNGYWIDLRDLFLHGDQFVNFALTATDASMVALPTAALLNRFASATDALGLFVDAGAQQIHSDGVVALTVAGNQVETT